jgi:DNA-binding LytR/AlgR family response regulator
MRKDVVTFALIMTVFWLFDRATAPPPAAAVSPTTPPPAEPSAELWLRDGATRTRIDAGDIVWVASAGNYVEYQLSGRAHLVRGTLSNEEERLLPFGIVRVHRTRLVNLKRVVAVEPRPSGDAALRLDTGETVVASRRYKQALEAIASA